MTPEQERQFAPLLAKAEAEGWADWIRDDRDRLAMLEGCYFDVAAAERFRLFCASFLKLDNPTPRDGRGLMIPFDLLDFQWRDICGPLFGWKRADGTRRYRFAFATMAKGNTKSAMAAAILLYCTFAEGEPTAVGYACSTTVQTARTVFNFCARLVKTSPLAKRLRVIDGTGRIVDQRTGSVLSVSPNKADAVEGKNVHVAVYDEIHLAKDRKLFEAIQYGGRSRAQSLIVVITTAADDEMSLAYELYDDAKKLISGAVVDPARFAYIAEATEADDILAPEVWEKANPALGVTINRDDLASAAQLAKDSPAKLRNFQRRRLNVWGLNDTATFLDFDKWKACRADVDPKALIGRDCYGGLDLASNTDLTAFVLVFPDDHGGIDVLAWHWLPEDVLAERARTDCEHYIQWNREGWLETTPGDYIDQTHIRRRIVEISADYNIREVAYDPAFAADLGPKLQSDGLSVFEFWQTHRMYTPVMAKLDALVLARDLRHQNPMLDWQASNLMAHTNEAGHMKPAKSSPRLKIDGMSSLLMALGHIVKGDGGPATTGYTESPLILI